MISGDIVDQAALHGTLNKIRNLNLALISVTKIDSRSVDASKGPPAVSHDIQRGSKSPVS